MTTNHVSSLLINILRSIVLIIGGLVSIVVVFAALTLFVPAKGNSLITIGIMTWSVLGPLFVVASLAVVIVTFVLRKKVKRWFANTTVVLSVLALLSSSGIVGNFIKVTYDNDGSINVLSTIWPFSTKPAVPDITKTYQVAEGKELKALVYKPRIQTNAAPIIMYIHGGGWISGEASDLSSTMRWYADQGWLVVSVDYRLASDQYATWDKAPADVAYALAWVSKHAEEWGGDNNKLIVMGDSAGGNLAVNLGWAAATNEAMQDPSDFRTIPKPKAVVAGYPVANPGYSYDYGQKWWNNQSPKDFTADYIGGSPKEHPERLAAISSLTYASPSAPPTLIVAAENDDFIPAQGTYEVVQKAKDMGVNITLRKFPSTHHGFDVIPGTLGDMAKRSVVTQFLKEQGLAPTTVR
ncbi:alpha/beta hydrolase [Paenibacillus sp. NPDC057934]|uniref:alpha/beta hydrolase n=1 Tax=Paenibacillus sp. NPDC057934 TaxID=3346282 RepID=UPI0036DB4434